MDAKHRQWVQIGMDRRRCGRRLFGPGVVRIPGEWPAFGGPWRVLLFGDQRRWRRLKSFCLSGDLLIKQRRNDAWADEKSVQAAADASKREIVVLKQSHGACSIFNRTMVHFRPLQSEGRPPICIRHHLARRQDLFSQRLDGLGGV